MVTRARPRIAAVVLARAELQRVHEHAHDDAVGRAPRGGEQAQVAVVDRAHRRHERHALVARSPARAQPPHVGDTTREPNGAGAQ
jgi:hypothetical protein